MDNILNALCCVRYEAGRSSASKPIKFEAVEKDAKGTTAGEQIGETSADSKSRGFLSEDSGSPHSPTSPGITRVGSEKASHRRSRGTTLGRTHSEGRSSRGSVSRTRSEGRRSAPSAVGQSRSEEVGRSSSTRSIDRTRSEGAVRRKRAPLIHLDGSPECRSLSEACAKGHERCVLALIDMNADIEKVGPQGCTSLMFSTLQGHEQCVRVLIDARAAVDQTNRDGSTALLMACQSGQEQCAQMLIDAKANVDAKNEDGETAFTIADEYGHDTCTDKLIEAGGPGAIAARARRRRKLTTLAENSEAERESDEEHG